MRRAILLLTLIGATLVACAGVVLAQQAPPGGDNRSSPPKTSTSRIPDSYIVVLERGQDPAQRANQHALEHGLQVRHVYDRVLNGYSAVIPQSRLSAIVNDPGVAYVEQDQVMTAVDQQTPWGITQVGGDVSPTNGPVGGNNPADPNSTVNAYIIDTGIDTRHADLKMAGHVNPSGASGGNKDCHGHGTHVAGTVGARDNTQDVVGSPSGVSLYGVKVLDCWGRGTTSGVIAGVNWVTGNATKPAIANMSLGGGASSSLDQAVRDSAASGVFYALAAGNDNKDACNYSPARAGRDTDTNGDGQPDPNGLMTVGATDKSDNKASFSNSGNCVDIWAPGVSILSTKRGGGTTTMSGTSMASPHGAGGGALYLTKSGNAAASPASVESALKDAAQPKSVGKRLYVGTF